MSSSHKDRLTEAQTVLALDTSTDMLACGVGELHAGEVCMLASRDHLCRRHANEEATLNCLDVLDAAGMSMGDVDAVLVGRGPGSFTGVRIAISTAKGIACGLGCPLYGVSTMDAVAWRAWMAGVRGRIGVVGDAMRKEVYPGIYSMADSGPVREFSTESVCKVTDCVELWAQLFQGCEESLQLTGDGLAKYQELFVRVGFSKVLSEELWHPSSESLLLAFANGSKGEAAASSGTGNNAGLQAATHGDPGIVLPVYTRLSDAEENERERLGDVHIGTTFGGDNSVLAQTSGVNEDLADIHLQLRPMSINDCAAIAALEADIFSNSPHTPWSEQVFIDEFSQPARIWWVAHDMGQIVGYAGGRLVGDECEITNVAVVTERRGEGIASRLVGRVAYDAYMLNARSVLLEVEAQNEPAKGLYTALGFSEVGRRTNYYGTGHDALLMQAELPLVEAPESLLEDPAPQSLGRTWPPAQASRAKEEQDLLAAAKPLILAIESSCDETAMAVIDGSGAILSSLVATQVDFHARFGGVVPEIASRKHVEAIVGVYEQTLEEAAATLGVRSLSARDFAAVAVTYGPGLVGALVVGVAFAKGLCASCNLPLIAVNHLEGHIFANLLTKPELTPPFVASVVSGGNTMLVHVRDWGNYEIMGETIDDAVGEAFDKVAKLLGLGYPGGPIISKLAAGGNPRAIRFPRAMMGSGDYRFSLSGLKTSVMNYVEKNNAAGIPINLPDLCASFEAAVIEVQVAKAIRAVEETGVTSFCLGGGVAANPALRSAYEQEFSKRRVDVVIPPQSACTDNAEMIALVARRLYEQGSFADLSLDASPNLRLA